MAAQCYFSDFSKSDLLPSGNEGDSAEKIFLASLPGQSDSAIYDDSKPSYIRMQSSTASNAIGQPHKKTKMADQNRLANRDHISQFAAGLITMKEDQADGTEKAVSLLYQKIVDGLGSEPDLLRDSARVASITIETSPSGSLVSKTSQAQVVSKHTVFFQNFFAQSELEPQDRNRAEKRHAHQSRETAGRDSKLTFSSSTHA